MHAYYFIRSHIKSWLLTFVLIYVSLVSTSFAKNILLIESYHAQYPWDASYLTGLKENLPANINLSTFEMDTKRLPPSEFEGSANKAWAAYEEQKPDLVILGDDNALKLLGPKFMQTKTPVVYLGINNNPRAYGVTNQPNFTGVLERPLIKRSMQLISDIVPMKKVLALFDDGTTAEVVKSEIFNKKDKLKIAGVEVDIKLIGQMDDVKSLIEQEKTNKTYDVVFIGLYHTVKNADGSRVPADDVLTWVADNSAVPVFAFWDFAVGKGKAAGGYVLFGKEQGIAAAELAQIMLSKGDDTVVPPKLGKKGRYLFSQSQLNKWGITLPANVKKSSSLLD